MDRGGAHLGHGRPWFVSVLRVLAVTASVLVFVSVGGAYAVYKHLGGNVQRCHGGPTCVVPTPEPGVVVPIPQHDATVNYLIIGSDNRQVPGGHKYGHGDFENLSDTVILAHFPGNRRSAQLISFPRDGLVTIPDCARADGSVVPAHTDKFNAAFAIGGPTCTIKTVETMSHIPIKDYIVVSLPGFVNISNALGGVEICLPQAVADPKSKLYLSAGRHKVKGETALAFVREREQLGGSRIRRQQEFLASAVKEATRTSLLLHPLRLYHLLDATTKSIETGGLSLTGLRRLALQFEHIKPSRVVFYTVPTLPETRQVLPGYDNPNGVYVDPIDTTTAAKLFREVRRGTLARAPRPTPTVTSTLGPTTTATPTPAPVPSFVADEDPCSADTGGSGPA